MNVFHLTRINFCFIYIWKKQRKKNKLSIIYYVGWWCVRESKCSKFVGHYHKVVQPADTSHSIRPFRDITAFRSLYIQHIQCIYIYEYKPFRASIKAFLCKQHTYIMTTKKDGNSGHSVWKSVKKMEGKKKEIIDGTSESAAGWHVPNSFLPFGAANNITEEKKTSNGTMFSPWAAALRRHSPSYTLSKAYRIFLNK